jgi:hypothetical protein
MVIPRHQRIALSSPAHEHRLRPSHRGRSECARFSAAANPCRHRRLFAKGAQEESGSSFYFYASFLGPNFKPSFISNDGLSIGRSRPSDQHLLT